MDPRSPGRESFGGCLIRSVPKITSRQEEELRLLDSLHHHMNKRLKADADYAIQLSRINAAALKACPKDTQEDISSIMQIWSVFLRATDKVITQINQNTQQMRTLLAAELQPLIKNKRSAGAAFNKDRLKAEDDYHASCTEVDNLHRSYGELARKSNKSKEKEKKAKPTERESFVQKYANAACRLHTCHNSYVLAIANTNSHQQFYKSTLLPFVFDTFQDRMELHVGEWKGVLEKYVGYIDLCEVYEEANKMIYSSLAKVNPNSEYYSFIRENRSKESPHLTSYDFDSSLVRLPAIQVAGAGEIAINNLTAVPLKEKLAELRKTLKSLRSQIDEKNAEMESAKRELLEIERKEGRPDSDRAQQLAVRISIVEGELENMKCKEIRSQVQAELIQKAFDRIGGEASVAPLFDPAVGDVTVDHATVLDERKDSVSSDNRKTLGRKLGKMFSKFTHRNRAATMEVGGNSKTPTNNHSAGADDSDDEEEEIPLEKESWYYADIPRLDADRLVKADGDYIVRFSGSKGYVLTTKWEGAAKHFVIQQLEDEATGMFSYRFEATAFPSIDELLANYKTNQMPITKRTQAVLKKPVNKQILDDDKYAMNRNSIALDRPPIGKGNFGDVFSGTLKDTGMRVAVKTCRSENIPETQQFIVEAKILKQYNHPNIVRLLGVCAEKDPIYIVMELMPGGDFLHFLRKHGVNQPARQLTKFALDAAQGMEYLASKNCIHRDLAARNCLVGDNNDVLKISDFGMSRESDDGIYTPASGARPIPVKWTAPEALNLGCFTSASDVWSYGVLLFETYSCGSSPYPGMSNNQAKDSIEQGHRMDAPEGTPDKVYGDIMVECWYYDSSDRPTFTDIVERLQGIISTL